MIDAGIVVRFRKRVSLTVFSRIRFPGYLAPFFRKREGNEDKHRQAKQAVQYGHHGLTPFGLKKIHQGSHPVFVDLDFEYGNFYII